MDAEPGPVNLDPAWSPAREPTLAFVHGAAPAPTGSGQKALAAWYAPRTLWYHIAGGNSLWLIRMFTGYSLAISSPVRVVTSLFAGPWPDYYGCVDWQSQFAWHS